MVPRFCFLLVLSALAVPVAAQFSETEISGRGSRPFYLAKGSWSYEDVPGVSYNFYRMQRGEAGSSCIHAGEPSATWSGDPEAPTSGNVMFYHVNAFNGFVENSLGSGGDGSPRPVARPCPCGGAGVATDIAGLRCADRTVQF